MSTYPINKKVNNEENKTKNINIKTTPDKKKEVSFEEQKNREMVKGIFHYHEVPGGIMKFFYNEFSDKVEHYELEDGEVYTIPLGVAKHLNDNGWYPIHAFEVDENGKPTRRIGKKVRRCSFQGLDFVSNDIQNDKKIITVENV